MATADSYGLFWNSDSGDRKYNADSFERWLRKFFTSGVFEGDLQVLASSGMTVNIQTGYCNLFGKVGLFEVVNSITLDAANSRYPRIDTIVVERNDTDRIISLKKVNGSYSGENPQPTAPIWDETQGIYQLVLAQIYIGAGVSSITQSNITDTRTDTSLCGYITGTVEEIDFAQITAQFEQYFVEFEQSNFAEFEEWFEHMKDQLSEDAAGHLQEEIDDINSDVAKTYKKDDSTANAIDDADYIPFYDSSAGETKKIVVGDFDLNIGSKIVSNSSDVYSPSSPYKVGDLVIHDNKLYRCITACSAAAWSVNQSCFTSDTLTHVANLLNTQLTPSNIVYGTSYGLTPRVFNCGGVKKVIIAGVTNSQLVGGTQYDIGVLQPQDASAYTGQNNVVDAGDRRWSIFINGNRHLIVQPNVTIANGTYVLMEFVTI